MGVKKSFTNLKMNLKKFGLLYLPFNDFGTFFQLPLKVFFAFLLL